MAAAILQGVCIAQYPLNDYDASVVFLTADKKITFLAPGINQAQSKNRANLALLAFSECEVFLARSEQKMSRLKTAHLLKSLNLQEQENRLYMNRIIRLFNYLEKGDVQLYNFFNNNYHLWGQGENTFLFTYLLYLALEPLGLKQNFSNCLVCSRSVQIIKVDLARGGFLCVKHSMQKTHLRVLKGFYYLTFDYQTYKEHINLNSNEIIKTQILELLKNNGILI